MVESTARAPSWVLRARRCQNASSFYKLSSFLPPPSLAVSNSPPTLHTPHSTILLAHPSDLIFYRLLQPPLHRNLHHIYKDVYTRATAPRTCFCPTSGCLNVTLLPDKSLLEKQPTTMADEELKNIPGKRLPSVWESRTRWSTSLIKVPEADERFAQPQ